VVRFERDSGAECDKKRAVARLADSHFKVIVTSPADVRMFRHPQ
jgi:hypothetical protein